MDLPKLRTTKFDFEPTLRDLNSFKLSVENCRITDVRILYKIIADQLKVETEMIEKEGQGDVHPLQYGVREFLENILAEMKKVEGIDDLGYYVIKTR